MPDWPVLALAAPAGLCLGSYAVTAGLRHSRAEGSTWGRSHCDACGVSLGFAQTLPVVSYVGLRGACAQCGARIDPIHLAGELAGAGIAVSVFWLDASSGTAALLLLLLLGFALLAAATVDARIKRLPDLLTAVIAVAGLVLSFLSGWTSLAAGLIAAIGAVSVLLAVRGLARRSGGDPGLGLGDVKLVGAMALWLGMSTPVMIAVASILGLIAAPWLRDKDRRIPFGPFIAFAGWMVGLAVEGGFTPWAL